MQVVGRGGGRGDGWPERQRAVVLGVLPAGAGRMAGAGQLFEAKLAKMYDPEAVRHLLLAQNIWHCPSKQVLDRYRRIMCRPLGCAVEAGPSMAIPRYGHQCLLCSL